MAIVKKIYFSIVVILIAYVCSVNSTYAAVTYATWNPADKNANVTLSGGNLVATTVVGASWYSSRSTIGVSSGKWYWEYTITALGTSQLNGIGLSNASIADGAYPGFDANGWGYLNNGQKYTNATGSAYGASWTTGDVLGIALDMDAGNIVIYKNGVSQGTMFTGLSGTIYAMHGLIGAGSSVTANFGATAFTYSVPSGYNAGLYTTTGASKGAYLGFFKFFRFR